jgi:hypothetical protein
MLDPHIGDRRGVYKVLVGKPEGNDLLGIPKLKCEENIKMDIQTLRCEVMDWKRAGSG